MKAAMGGSYGIIYMLKKNMLGCMARNTHREQIYEAMDWFKEALQKNQVLCIHLHNMHAVVSQISVHAWMLNITCNFGPHGYY